ncbi:hypothetical protein L6Q21_09680 [Sandaracinobacter sp. RS1-74]|uniref:hypothetical protein n=1 Tax=Sandaracinobacteroides sayramensis TaxID=2913411 RepID=UPI001ED9D5C5|nr:hypothetical protein [Sandaracinobacteroides sayramensis]MCG2841249.1 hypothetical protein [Sandaracinobacteroides sayramensis]
MAAKIATIGAWLGELIDAHMLRCDEAFPHPDDCPPHIVSEAHGTRANIEKMHSVDLGTGHLIVIELDDGTAFDIRVNTHGDAVDRRETHERMPLPRERAAAVIDAASRDPFGFKTDLAAQMTPEEIAACRRYWSSTAPGSWSFNDVVRRCAGAA